MPNTMTQFLSFFLVVLLSMLACVALGVALALYTMRRASALASNLMRTGTPDPVPAPDGGEIRAPSAEAAAQTRVLHDAIERGADQLQAVGKAAGRPLSRQQALKDAADMLHAPPLGGVQ